jgi:hypothetical protein
MEPYANWYTGAHMGQKASQKGTQQNSLRIASEIREIPGKAWKVAHIKLVSRVYLYESMLHLPNLYGKLTKA